jgi:hypothetical protein
MQLLCRGTTRIVKANFDYEPNEAAAIVLDCKQVRSLTKGKSNKYPNMLIDKRCEEIS